MLHIKELTYRIGGRPLFSGTSAHIPRGQRVGLVGMNGAGKTTLFRLIAGDLEPDGGSVRVTGRARLGHIAQEAPAGEDSLIETVFAADQELSTLESAANAETDPQHIAEIHTRLADIGAHTAQSRAATILAGLGFDEAAQQRRCKDFSGGWRMRVALAGTLFARPDLLLLDEPTNHLDLEASVWLEDYLSRFLGTLVIISHDRDLLNRVVGHILYLEDGRLTMYVGGYDRFKQTLNEKRSRDKALREKQIKERAHIQAFVDRFRYKATKARQAQSRLKVLTRMEPIANAVEQRTISFQFPRPSKLAPPMLTMEDTVAGYTGRTVLKELNLQIDPDDRIALLGANGNGKSTLMKLLSGRLSPTAGEIKRSNNLQIGYFAQHQSDELNETETPYELLSRSMENTRVENVRAQLGRFGFEAAHVDTEIGSLSGGEKSRLLFCLMTTNSPQLLLLDEPTNHLDMDARDALVHALNEFPGAVILVSHDPHTIGLVADRLWLVDGGTCHTFDGDMEDYRNLLLNNKRVRRASERTNTESGATRGSTVRKEKRRKKAAAREGTTALRKSIKDSENRIETLGNQITSLESELARPEIYEGTTANMVAISEKLSDAKKEMKKEEARWMDAEKTLTIVVASSAEDH